MEKPIAVDYLSYRYWSSSQQNNAANSSTHKEGL